MEYHSLTRSERSTKQLTPAKRGLGVSNFNAHMVVEAQQLSKHTLVTNQVEFHPYLNQRIVLNATRHAGMVLTAYCAMAVGRVFQERVLETIAADHRRSITQVVLRWVLQHDGAIALSRTSDPERVADNADVFDFELSADEMSTIRTLADRNSRIVNPPGLAPVWDETPAHME
jgi:2,5-diketo-D-gluconate reductase B